MDPLSLHLLFFSLHRQTLLLHWRVQLKPDLLRSLPLPVFPPALLKGFCGGDRGGRHRHPRDVRRLRKFFGLPEGTVLPGGKVERRSAKKSCFPTCLPSPGASRARTTATADPTANAGADDVRTRDAPTLRNAQVIDVLVR